VRPSRQRSPQGTDAKLTGPCGPGPDKSHALGLTAAEGPEAPMADPVAIAPRPDIRGRAAREVDLEILSCGWAGAGAVH